MSGRCAGRRRRGPCVREAWGVHRADERGRRRDRPGGEGVQRKGFISRFPAGNKPRSPTRFASSVRTVWGGWGKRVLEPLSRARAPGSGRAPPRLSASPRGRRWRPRGDREPRGRAGPGAGVRPGEAGSARRPGLLLRGRQPRRRAAAPGGRGPGARGGLCAAPRSGAASPASCAPSERGRARARTPGE